MQRGKSQARLNLSRGTNYILIHLYSSQQNGDWVMTYLKHMIIQVQCPTIDNLKRNTLEPKTVVKLTRCKLT